MKSKQIIVSGLVQGVGFRNYTLKAAIKLGITGWARNLYSSQVEILAQAKDEETMKAFVAEVKKGPTRCKVDDLEIIDVDLKGPSCDTFTIEPDGEKKRDF